MLEQIAAEGVVQDGYMNALSQGYGEAGRMSTSLLIVLSVAEAVVVVVVLALALIEIRRRLESIASDLERSRRGAVHGRGGASAPAAPRGGERSTRSSTASSA